MTHSDKISNFWLKISYWFVSHKLFFKKLLIIGLIILNVGLFGWTIFQTLIILVVQEKDFQQMLGGLTYDLIDYQYFNQKIKAKDLELLSLDILPVTEGRYDIVARVKNPNSDWVVKKVIYQFISGDKVIAEKTSFIFPGEEKFLAVFNTEPTSLGGVTLRFKEISWQRELNFADFSPQYLNFDISEINIMTPSQLSIRGKLPVTKVTFKVKNQSAYNFWQVGFYVALYSGSKLIGLNYTLLDQFKSGEEKRAEVNWIQSLSTPNRAEILPEVDILNPDVYMPFELGPGEVK